jgi:membrane associated rhomboid family serine protease
MVAIVLLLLSTASLLWPDAWSEALALSTAHPLSWQLLTHSLVHAFPLHVIGNFWFGLPALLYLEKTLGKVRCLAVFELACVSGALLHCAAVPMPGELLGSSGGMTGAVAAALCLGASDPAAQKLKGVVVTMLALFLLREALNVATADPGAHVANWAHLGGCLAGLWCAQLVLSRQNAKLLSSK